MEALYQLSYSPGELQRLAAGVVRENLVPAPKEVSLDPVSRSRTLGLVGLEVSICWTTDN